MTRQGTGRRLNVEHVARAHAALQPPRIVDAATGDRSHAVHLRWTHRDRPPVPVEAGLAARAERAGRAGRDPFGCPVSQLDETRRSGPASSPHGRLPVSHRRPKQRERVFVEGVRDSRPRGMGGGRPNTLASRVDRAACGTLDAFVDVVAFRPIWGKSVSRKSQGRPVQGRPPGSAFSAAESPDLPFSPHGLRERAKGARRGGESMSTHAPTGFNWPDAMRPLEARRRARAVGSFAEYVAKDIHGDRSRALEAIASLARWRPAVVDASVLQRAARHARRAGEGR